MPRPRVKICCIQSLDEAWMAVDHGASALGLVSEMPSGPGVIDDRLIAAIAARIPPAVASFLLTSKQNASAVIQQQRRTGVNTVQLCDRLMLGSHRDLRSAMPGVALVQVVHVRDRRCVEEALALAPDVDALLLDSGDPTLPVKELGGTGRTHDWETSRRIREILDVPVFLAGGLTADNVAEAIARVAPFGVDVCSGVRTEGRLDEEKLARFIGAVVGARPET